MTIPTWTAPLTLTSNGIFVFGSNLTGRHSEGAAQTALRQYGAVYGQGLGLQGRSYALPTMDSAIRTLPLNEIARYAEAFEAFASDNPELLFFLTRLGCGLAGYTDRQIAPLFLNAPQNVLRPPEWGRGLR